MATQRIDGWIRGCLGKIGDEHKGCIALTCEHIKQGGNQGKEISTIKIAEGCPIPSVELAETLENSAEVFAEGIPGMQQFRIVAHFGDHTTLEFPFRKRGEPDDSGLGSESASPQGLLAQHMRHTEAVVRLGMVHSQTLLESAVKLLDSQTKAYHELMMENADSFKISKDLLMQQALENRSHELEVLRARQRSDLWRKALQFAPPLANRLLGSEVFPQATVDTALIEGIAEHISPEQIEMLTAMPGIPEELKAVLIDRLKEAWDKKQKEKEAQSTAIVEKSDGASR